MHSVIFLFKFNCKISDYQFSQEKGSSFQTDFDLLLIDRLIRMEIIWIIFPTLIIIKYCFSIKKTYYQKDELKALIQISLFKRIIEF